MKRIVPLLAGVCLLMALFATPAAAEEVPPLPHAFYGTVELSDGPAPIGTQVEARGTGVLIPIKGNPIVTTEAGKYGGPGGLDPKLVVQGDIEEGTPLAFFINGVVADQTWEWHTGDVTELNLTVAAAPEVTHELTMAVVGEGTVSPDSGTYAEGGMTITATATSGWEFSSWSTGDMSEIANASSAATTLTLDKNKTVTAIFAEIGALAVTTDPATRIGTRSATLRGSLTDLGDASLVEVSFEWGTTTSYGNETVAQTMTSAGSFSANLSGLSARTSYHFRARAVGEGTSYGLDRAFTTRATGGGGGGAGGGRDTIAPRISDIAVSNITETSADISWTTHEKSDSQVEYGSTLSPLDETMVISHLVHLTKLTPGTEYNFKVRSADKADNLRVSDELSFTTLGEAPAAAFASSDLSISPSEVAIGETVTISATVSNTGTATGSYTVTFKINGVVDDTREVTLEASASEKVTFTTVKDTAGSYEVSVDGLSGSFTVKAAPPLPTPAPTPTPTPTPEGPFNWPLVGGIIAAVVIVAVVAFFWIRRRRAA